VQNATFSRAPITIISLPWCHWESCTLTAHLRYSCFWRFEPGPDTFVKASWTGHRLFCRMASWTGHRLFCRLFLKIGTRSYHFLWAPTCQHFKRCSCVSFSSWHLGHLCKSDASGDILLPVVRYWATHEWATHECSLMFLFTSRVPGRYPDFISLSSQWLKSRALRIPGRPRTKQFLAGAEFRAMGVPGRPETQPNARISFWPYLLLSRLQRS
jgi:hypothetical protein